MNIIVVGCGKIGTTVLENLVDEGHNVTAVDIRPSALTDITNIHDVMTVCGNGGDWETLATAGVESADLVVAATGSDEVNMLCCYMARCTGAAHTVARVRNPEYNDRSLQTMRQHLNLSAAINPDRLAAMELYNILRLPAAAKVESFSARRFEMIEIKLKEDSPLAGMPLSEARHRFKANFLICVVKRGGQTFIPDGNFVLQGGDKVGVSATYSEMQKLIKALGLAKKQARDVMLLGGSRIAYYLAKRLLSAGVGVKIIDKDRAVCETLCELLPDATVICGDGAQQEVLLEEGLADMDAFVSLTGLDEVNILLSCLAATHNVPKVITKVSRPEMMGLAQQLGVECVVSPRAIVADMLVENSMGSNVDARYSLMDDGAEALVFNVKDDPRLVRIPLKDLALKPQVLIAGMMRGRDVIIPTGNDTILPGDKVVVITTDRHRNDLADILK